MKKGERTRARVLDQAAGLFNRHGYGSTPVSAIMAETGMQKGGLYGHFPSKEGMAIEAFRRNASKIARHLVCTAEGAVDPSTRLRRLLEASLPIASGDVVPGGCPVLNAATEADDAWPELRAEAARGAVWLERTLQDAVEAVIRESGEAPDMDVESLSLALFASLEGGIMLAKLHGSLDPLRATLRMLDKVLETVLKAPVGAKDRNVDGPPTSSDRPHQGETNE